LQSNQQGLQASEGSSDCFLEKTIRSHGLEEHSVVGVFARLDDDRLFGGAAIRT
jgi:hypothetical protein